MLRKGLLALVLFAAAGFVLPAAAQGEKPLSTTEKAPPSRVTGWFCDTRAQAARVVQLAVGVELEDAVRQVNKEVDKPDACSAVTVFYSHAGERASIEAATGYIYLVMELEVVGWHTPQGVKWAATPVH